MFPAMSTDFPDTTLFRSAAIAGAGSGGCPLAGAAKARQMAVRRPPRQGQLHLCRRHRLSGMEDQPPCGHRDTDQAMAAPLAADRRAYSAAAAVPGWCDPLSAFDSACARTVSV